MIILQSSCAGHRPEFCCASMLPALVGTALFSLYLRPPLVSTFNQNP